MKKQDKTLPFTLLGAAFLNDFRLFIYNIVGWVKRQRNPTKTRIMLGFVPQPNLLKRLFACFCQTA